MRITNSMMVSGFLKNLGKNSQKVDKYQNQVITGKAIQKPSDDPVSANKIMKFNTSLQKVKQYTNNATEASEWLTETETSLNEMNSLLKRASELTVSAASGTNGPDERKAIGEEIKQIQEQLVSTANSSLNGRYIFGGSNTTQQPFEIKSFSGVQALYYNGENLAGLTDSANATKYDELKAEKVNYEIGFGTKMDVSYNGIDMLGAGENNAFNVFGKLVTALNNGDSGTISSSISALQNISDNITTKMADIGGKSNRIELFSTRLDNENDSLKNMLSEVEDVDIETAIMNMNMQEATYQAALSAGAKIISKTLVDFVS